MWSLEFLHLFCTASTRHPGGAGQTDEGESGFQNSSNSDAEQTVNQFDRNSNEELNYRFLISSTRRCTQNLIQIRSGCNSSLYT